MHSKKKLWVDIDVRVPNIFVCVCGGGSSDPCAPSLIATYDCHQLYHHKDTLPYMYTHVATSVLQLIRNKSNSVQV